MDKIKVFLLATLCTLLVLHNQVCSQMLEGTGRIPLQWQVDWTNAGLLPAVRSGGFSPVTPTSTDNIHLITHGGDYTTKIQNAITAAEASAGSDIIYFPGGIYDLSGSSIFELRNNGTHNHSNIIFRGAGANQTIIRFTAGKDGSVFDIQGCISSSDYSVSDITKNSHRITSTGFGGVQGDWVHLHEMSFPADDDAVIGQITQIYANIATDIDSIKDAANKDYLNSRGLVVRKILPITNVGIEDMTIIRMDGEQSTSEQYDSGSNIKFEHAVNCWVKGVHLQNTCRHHITIDKSSHIEVSGCLVQFAQYYGGDSYGYGVVLGASSTNCLVENNIFTSLRHSLGIGTGANGNVITFNYSTSEQASYYAPDFTLWGVPIFKWLPIDVYYQDSDLCLHGRFSYANLYEYNYVEWIEADDTHGANGYFNAFVRNKVYDEDNIKIENTRYFSVLGCETDEVDIEDGSSPYFDAYGCRYPDSVWCDHETASLFNKSVFSLGDVSYYYSSAPSFLGSIMFPSIGPRTDMSSPVPPDNIPARERCDDTEFNYTYLPNPSPFPASSPYDIVFGDANPTLTKQSDNTTINFIDDPRPDLAPGPYICDRYKLEVHKYFYNPFTDIPSCWLNYYGYSNSGDNYARHCLYETSTHSSTTLSTYFYFIETNILGQQIPVQKWAPFDPQQLTFKYGAIGILGSPTTSGEITTKCKWFGCWIKKVGFFVRIKTIFGWNVLSQRHTIAVITAQGRPCIVR